MQLTEDLARYVIGLQSYKECEFGLDDNDRLFRVQLEEAFPTLKTPQPK